MNLKSEQRSGAGQGPGMSHRSRPDSRAALHRLKKSVNTAAPRAPGRAGEISTAAASEPPSACESRRCVGVAPSASLSVGLPAPLRYCLQPCATVTSLSAQAPLDLIPPFRFGMVEEDLFRGGYPTLRHFPFLQNLKLRAILSLTPEKPTYDLESFAEAEAIHLKHISIERFKGDVILSPADLNIALQFILDAEHYPLYIHCLDGRHVVGMIVLALRRLRNWDAEASRAEYIRFASEIQEDLSAVNDFTGPIVVTGSLPAWLTGRDSGDERRRRNFFGGIKVKTSEMLNDVVIAAPTLKRQEASPVTPVTPFVSFASALHGVGRTFEDYESSIPPMHVPRVNLSGSPNRATRYIVVDTEIPQMITDPAPFPYTPLQQRQYVDEVPGVNGAAEHLPDPLITGCPLPVEDSGGHLDFFFPAPSPPVRAKSGKGQKRRQSC